LRVARYFAFNQIVKHLRMITRDFAKANYMPASKAVRLQRNTLDQKFSPLRVGSITTRKLGNLKELLQKGGYRDFSWNLLPIPRLGANPTLKGASCAA
jgi:hypothetical protein